MLVNYSYLTRFWKRFISRNAGGVPAASRTKKRQPQPGPPSADKHALLGRIPPRPGDFA